MRTMGVAAFGKQIQLDLAKCVQVCSTTEGCSLHSSSPQRQVGAPVLSAPVRDNRCFETETQRLSDGGLNNAADWALLCLLILPVLTHTLPLVRGEKYSRTWGISRSYRRCMCCVCDNGHVSSTILPQQAQTTNQRCLHLQWRTIFTGGACAAVPGEPLDVLWPEPQHPYYSQRCCS